MGRIKAASAHGLGSTKDSGIFSKNHYASSRPLSAEVKAKIASLSLQRVAGNVYECPSTADFWKVKGNAIVRLTVDEVDNGESIPAAPKNQPMAFLNSILDDLDF